MPRETQSQAIKQSNDHPRANQQALNEESSAAPSQNHIDKHSKEKSLAISRSADSSISIKARMLRRIDNMQHARLLEDEEAEELGDCIMWCNFVEPMIVPFEAFPEDDEKAAKWLRVYLRKKQ